MLSYNLIILIQKLYENDNTILKASFCCCCWGFGWLVVFLFWFFGIKCQILPKKPLITEVVNPSSTSCCFPDVVPYKIYLP